MGKPTPILGVTFVYKLLNNDELELAIICYFNFPYRCKDGVLGVMCGSFAVISSVCVLILYVFFSTDIYITQYVISVYQVSIGQSETTLAI